jgi:fatty-acyl-CoA synthase/long-chain acyl-CoA synthetase
MYRGIELWPGDMTGDMVKKKIAEDKVVWTYPNLPKNLYSSLRKTAMRLPEKTAVIDNWGRTYTYEDLLRKVEKFSAWLYDSMGIRREKHVAVMMYNSVEFCVTFLALNRIGAVLIPLPSKFRPEEVQSLLKKSDVDYIISHERFRDDFCDCEAAGIPVCIVPDEEAGYALDVFSCEKDLRQQLLQAESEVEDGDLALLVFTSGTTSQSKGVMIRNYNIMHAVVSYERTLGIREKDSALIPIPIYLITGLIAVFGLMVHVGGTVCLHRFFDGKRVLEDAKKYNITFFHASPTVFTLLLKEASSFPSLPSLRMFACGSSNMPPARIRQLHEWLPNCQFRTIYGLTETTSPGTVFPTDAGESNYIGSSGIPIPGLEFKVLDKEGKELPDGEQGEIWVKGTNITSAYYKLQTDAIKDGWLNTGDIGYFNSEGYLYIVDRVKDMINRGGEKVCSFDVENELLNIADVEDAAVVGIPDELYGEVPAAVVRLHSGSTISEEEMKKILKGKMAGYKVPVQIRVLDQIPITENMKTDKKRIRQMFAK